MSEKRYYGLTKLELSWKKILEKEGGSAASFHKLMQSLICGRFFGSISIIFRIKFTIEWSLTLRSKSSLGL